MSLLNVVADAIATEGARLDKLGSSLRAATAAAAAQTAAIAARAAGEVSAVITQLFGTNAQEFQAASANAAAFHNQFVNLLNGGTAQYLHAEAANAQQLLATAVNTRGRALLGRPLIGTGQSIANGAGGMNGFGDLTSNSVLGFSTTPNPITNLETLKFLGTPLLHWTNTDSGIGISNIRFGSPYPPSPEQIFGQETSTQPGDGYLQVGNNVYALNSWTDTTTTYIADIFGLDFSFASPLMSPQLDPGAVPVYESDVFDNVVPIKNLLKIGKKGR